MCKKKTCLHGESQSNGAISTEPNPLCVEAASLVIAAGQYSLLHFWEKKERYVKVSPGLSH